MMGSDIAVKCKLKVKEQKQYTLQFITELTIVRAQ